MLGLLPLRAQVPMAVSGKCQEQVLRSPRHSPGLQLVLLLVLLRSVPGDPVLCPGCPPPGLPVLGSQLLILPVPGGPVLGPDCLAPGLPVLGQWQLVGLVGGFPESRYRHRPRVGCHGRCRVVGRPLGRKVRSQVESHCHVGPGYW